MLSIDLIDVITSKTIKEVIKKGKACRHRWSRGNVLASRSKVRVQTQLRSMDFSGRKIPEHKSSGWLKNLKPEKIVL